MRDDFAVFILSHERSKDCFTAEMLRRKKFSGRWFVVVDDQDKELGVYKEKYVDHLLIFSKMSIIGKFDPFINMTILGASIYARIYIQEIAQDFKLKVYAEFDDDIKELYVRRIENGKCRARRIENINSLFEKTVNFVEYSDICCLAYATHATMIGANEKTLQKTPRKASNAYFFNVSKPVNWAGISFEDMITSVLEGIKGKVIFTDQIVNIAYPKAEDKKGNRNQIGGMSETYKILDKYSMEFFSVMAYPSIASMVSYKGKWSAARKLTGGVPQIISQKWQKERDE